MRGQLTTRWHAALTLLVVALLALPLGACSTLEVGVEHTPGAAGVATAAPTSAPPATATVPEPTSAPPATGTVPEPTSAPPATAEPTPTPAGVDHVNIYLVALEDGGVAGEAIGCGDSIVAVEREITPTHEPLRAAYEELLSIHDRDYGESGLYNALYQCDLQLEQVSLAGGVATVELAGTFMLGGTCDNPRVEAQLTEPALQFTTVREVQVFVNGRPLGELLSLK